MTDAEVSQFFDTEANGWSGRYASDPRFERRFEKITRLISRVFPTTPGHALDIGCGSGIFSRYLASRGYNVIGIDLSEKMIEHAKASSKNTSIEYIPVSIEDYTAPDGTFDFILSLSMLEYVDDDEAAIEKCVALLKPGGLLVVSVPNRKGLLRIAESTVYGIRTATKGKIFAGRGEYLAHQKRQYSPLELDLIMRLRGMKKRRAMFSSAGMTQPKWLLSLFERRWWAAIYCCAYEKKIR